jgi:hypothetical protein
LFPETGAGEDVAAPKPAAGVEAPVFEAGTAGTLNSGFGAAGADVGVAATSGGATPKGLGLTGLFPAAFDDGGKKDGTFGALPVVGEVDEDGPPRPIPKGLGAETDALGGLKPPGAAAAGVVAVGDGTEKLEGVGVEVAAGVGDADVTVDSDFSLPSLILLMLSASKSCFSHLEKLFP